MKVFLLVYDEDIGERSLLRFLNTRKEILDWMTILPASIFLVSRHSLRHLTEMLSKKYPAAQFLITELETMRTEGMLPEECWDFINSPGK